MYLEALVWISTIQYSILSFALFTYQNKHCNGIYFPAQCYKVVVIKPLNHVIRCWKDLIQRQKAKTFFSVPKKFYPLPKGVIMSLCDLLTLLLRKAILPREFHPALIVRIINYQLIKLNDFDKNKLYQQSVNSVFMNKPNSSQIDIKNLEYNSFHLKIQSYCPFSNKAGSRAKSQGGAKFSRGVHLVRTSALHPEIARRWRKSLKLLWFWIDHILLILNWSYLNFFSGCKILQRWCNFLREVQISQGGANFSQGGAHPLWIRLCFQISNGFINY